MPLNVDKNKRWVDIASGRNGKTMPEIGNCLHGTENDLILPLHGRVFEQDYPFKIKIFNSTAPVLRGDSNINIFSLFNPVQLANLKITVSVAIQFGKIYDLAKLAIEKKSPVAVSKRKSGNYKILTSSQNSLATEAEIDFLRVPVYVNGAEMKPIDLLSNSSMLSQSFNLEFEYNDTGIGFKGNGTRYDDYNIYLVLSFSTKNGGSYSEKYDLISSVNIVTGKQIREQEISDTENEILTLFTPWGKAGYHHLPIDSSYYHYLKTQSIFKIDPWYPGFNPNVTFTADPNFQSSYKDSIYYSNLDKGKIFYLYFRIENNYDTMVSDLNLFDHLFLRSFRPY